MENPPGVGMCVIVTKDNKVLMGKRIGAHGENTWSFPGGHLEFNETLEECATRETKEETGIQIKNVRIGSFTNDIFEKEKKHYITLFMVADYDSGDVGIKEPDKCLEWNWFEWDNLPSPLFLPIQNLLKQGFNPFDKQA
jgi:8-oxo-dGTP diphosphatase